MAKKPFTLSKSRYIRGLQCHKSLWLYTHDRDLQEVSKSATASFQQGDEVGAIARNIFPKGKFIAFDNMSFEEQISETQKALKKEKVIYEAAFSYGGVFVKADILRKVGGSWELYEVKACNSRKDVHLDDIAIQHYVITGSGVPISKAFLTHLNKEYTRDGELDVQALFTSEDVTDEIKAKQEAIKAEIGRQQKMLAGKEPIIDIGPHCTNPYNCDFAGHCWKNVPDNSIFDLTGNGVKKWPLYKDGILKMEDIPLGKLKGLQLQQVKTYLGKKTVVDPTGLKTFLKELWYPLYYLDFETFLAAVPPYDGLKPYQQIPFQYSLHSQKRAGGKLTHKEFLANPNCDPREELLDSLLDEIPSNACVLVYFQPFELGRLKELAQQFPKKAKQINAIISNVRDLLVPFKGRALYSWKQQGSHSIKNVLPAFVKNMSYEGLEIGDGGEAIEAYQKMCAVADDPKALGKIRQDLLEYCGQDTLAMVRLLEVVEAKSKLK
ncbi:MAG: DUF2779 domain-containing protein [Desulfuromonadaceae bacterium]|nr:DUF2779 domain-containing protein [Desulfuromonadaceae bacterium]